MYSNKMLPDAISHRGLRSAAPENTIAAFEAAITAGCDGIELDVHGTVDGTLFVHHDPTFELEGARIPFAMADPHDVAKARLAGDHAIPKLDAVLEAIGARTQVYIEVKAIGIENDVARCLARHIENMGDYAVHAFDHRVVKRVLELSPSVRTGILQVGYPIDSCAEMRAAGATDLWQHTDFVDSTLVADVHSCSGRLIVWTANEESQWHALAALGVDGICTDRVDEYVAWRNAQTS
jgi:glycerophosphoryl diester phosphodiesterase